MTVNERHFFIAEFELTFFVCSLKGIDSGHLIRLRQMREQVIGIVPNKSGISVAKSGIWFFYLVPIVLCHMVNVLLRESKFRHHETALHQCTSSGSYHLITEEINSSR